MTCEQIATLLPDYLHAALATEDRRLVESHLQSCELCKDEVALWQKLALLPQEEPGPGARTRFHAMLEAYQAGRLPQDHPRKRGWNILPGFLSGNWLRTPAAGLAWAILLLAIGFLAGRSMNPPNHSEQQLAQVRDDLANMRQLVTLSLLQQQSASERLQAIAQATAWNLSEKRPDPKVLSALMHTLRSDNNVDVRLAAVDALGRFHGDPQVQQGLMDALRTQDSPLVQVALIDLMVETKDANAVQQLKQFEQDPKVNPTVRQRAQWGIKQLT